MSISTSSTTSFSSRQSPPNTDTRALSGVSSVGGGVGGGLSRSSRSDSLAVLAASAISSPSSVESSVQSPWSDESSRANSPTPPSSSSSGAALPLPLSMKGVGRLSPSASPSASASTSTSSSPAHTSVNVGNQNGHGTGNGNGMSSGNSGFVVTSRFKPYQPPVLIPASRQIPFALPKAIDVGWNSLSSHHEDSTPLSSALSSLQTPLPPPSFSSTSSSSSSTTTAAGTSNSPTTTPSALGRLSRPQSLSHLRGDGKGARVDSDDDDDDEEKRFHERDWSTSYLSPPRPSSNTPHASTSNSAPTTAISSPSIGSGSGNGIGTGHGGGAFGFLRRDNSRGSSKSHPQHHHHQSSPSRQMVPDFQSSNRRPSSPIREGGKESRRSLSSGHSHYQGQPQPQPQEQQLNHQNGSFETSYGTSTTNYNNINNPSTTATTPSTSTMTTTTTTNDTPKTTLTLSSSIDSKGRRMVNQYVRLKTIGQGSHGKVWLCAEPILSGVNEEHDHDHGDDEEDENNVNDVIHVDDDDDEGRRNTFERGSRRRTKPLEYGDGDRFRNGGGGEGGGGEVEQEDTGLFKKRSSRSHTKSLSQNRFDPSNSNGIGSSTGAGHHSKDLELGDVQYCAIKSVAREGQGRGKSLRLAKGRKNQTTGGSGGIGADDKVKREVAIMKRLHHKNVVRLKEVIDDVKSKKVFMVLEFMAGGQIVWQDEQKHPTMTIDEARRTFRDVVLGLEYLHYQGIIHRDIKPANLLWTEDHSTVKISDFGVSHVSDALQRASPSESIEYDDDNALRKTAGSPAFFAPELCHSADYTPTPQAEEGEHAYFADSSVYAVENDGSRNNRNSHRLNDDFEDDGVESLDAIQPKSPNGLPLSSYFISQPLPVPDPQTPRIRPNIGQGIDVWALGVTLFCLLFGDTPFMAQTEYELYNVIVREPIRVPEKMGVEGEWTGYGRGWKGCGDGVEGKEVVDLLGKLLEKDPAKRISLEQVKKHPWVLRNLSLSPDSWLNDTDPARNDTVVITEEDVEHATQERGTVDALPQIRNRPGVRRALQAALVRFPAFSRMKNHQQSTLASLGNRHARSKSVSSTSQSVLDGTSDTTRSDIPSRHPSDGASSRQKVKVSGHDLGAELRKIISRGEPSPSRSTSPAVGVPGGGRGGWAMRGKKDPGTATAPGSPFPQLSRSVSASSVPGTVTRPQSLSQPPSSYLLPSTTGKESVDRDSHSSRRTPSTGSAYASRGLSPGFATPDSETAGRRTLNKMLSKLSGGGRRATTVDRKSSASEEDNAYMTEDDPIISARRGSLPVDGHPIARSTVALGGVAAGSSARGIAPQLPDEGGMVDPSEFEYSSDDDEYDDDDDEVNEPPLAQADGITGWQSNFGAFNIGVREDTHQGHGEGTLEAVSPDKEDYKLPTMTLEDSTPRASAHMALAAKGIDPDPSNIPPPLVRQYSESPSRRTIKVASNRDGSIYDGHESHASVTSADPNSAGSGARRWQSHGENERHQFDDDDAEDDEQEIFVAPRRKRAPTLATN